MQEVTQGLDVGPGAAESVGTATLTHAYKCEGRLTHSRAPYTHGPPAQTPAPRAPGALGSRPALPERLCPVLPALRVLSGPRGTGEVRMCPSELPGTFPGALPVLGSPRTCGSFSSGPLDRGQEVGRGGHGPPPQTLEARKEPMAQLWALHSTDCDPPEHRCVPRSVGVSTCSDARSQCTPGPRHPPRTPVCCLPVGALLGMGRLLCPGDPGLVHMTVWSGHLWPHSGKAVAAFSSWSQPSHFPTLGSGPTGSHILGRQGWIR